MILDPGPLAEPAHSVNRVDALECHQEEVVLVRNRRNVARLVPEAPHQDALSVFGDLYRTLDDWSADASVAATAVANAGADACRI